MIDDQLRDEIRKLKRNAIALRNREELDLALESLDQVIKTLESLLKVADEADQKDLRNELADTYGMKGGIYRRQNKLSEALDAYTEGRKLEQIDKSSTYNLSNIISLKIQSQNSFPDELHKEINTAIKQLQQETQGARKDEWWAWADLAQFYLLQNKPDEARKCYAEARSKTGATKEEIGRNISILDELGNELRHIEPAIYEEIGSIVSGFFSDK